MFASTTPLALHLLRSIRIAAAGDASVLVPADLDLRGLTLGEKELLVRTSFAGVNYIDTYYRTGLYATDKVYPYIPGSEASGAVVGVGPNVTRDWMGRRVAFFRVRSPQWGAYSSFTVLHEDDAFEVPEGVEDRVVAAAMLQGLTAHYLTHDCFVAKPGSTVLVHAAAGGTGLLICQMAKLRGATVIGVCGSADKCELARTQGKADHVIDYSAVHWQAVVKQLAPGGVDAVYDGVGKATFLKGLEVLRPRGSMVTFGNASGPVDPISPLLLTKYGSLILQRPSLNHFVDKASGEVDRRVADVFGWLRSGELKVHIGKEFALQDSANAHRHLESKNSVGKILINCQE